MFGTDQFECVNWRVGALLYMYVHQLMASEKRREAEDTAFIREVCMRHFSLMLMSSGDVCVARKTFGIGAVW